MFFSHLRILSKIDNTNVKLPVGRLETLTCHLQTLFSILRYFIRRHFAVKELNDGEDETSFVGHFDDLSMTNLKKQNEKYKMIYKNITLRWPVRLKSSQM